MCDWVWQVVTLIVNFEPIKKTANQTLIPEIHKIFKTKSNDIIALLLFIMIMIMFLEPSLDGDGVNLLLNFSKEGNSLLLSASKKIT